MSYPDHWRTPGPRGRTDSTRPAGSPRRGRHGSSAGGSSRPSSTRPGTRRASTAPDSRASAGARTPATVWTCGGSPIDPDAAWPTPVVEKIVSSFTDPGRRVVLLPWPSPAPATEELLGASPARGPRGESDGDLDVAVTAIRRLDRTAQVHRLTPVPDARGPISRPYWADLLDAPHGVANTDAPEHSAAALDGLDGDASGADLIITSLRPEYSRDRVSDHLALASARLLRTGGILAVLTHSDASRGELVDPTGPVVAAAQNADLLYLQHIVVLLVPIRDGAFVIDADSGHGVDEDRTRHRAEVRGLPAPHHRIHADLLVFAQPHDHEALSLSPTDAAVETGVLR